MNPAEAQDQALTAWTAANLAYLTETCGAKPWNDPQDTDSSEEKDR